AIASPASTASRGAPRGYAPRAGATTYSPRTQVGYAARDGLMFLRLDRRRGKESSEMTDLLETTEDGIAWLTLNRPDRLNAFSPAMLQGLGEAVQRLGRGDNGRARVHSGLGRRLRHRKGARALSPWRHHRRRAGAGARPRQPRRRGRITARGDHGAGTAYRRRTPNRLRLHEAQSARCRNRAAGRGARNGGGAPGA